MFCAFCSLTFCQMVCPSDRHQLAWDPPSPNYQEPTPKQSDPNTQSSKTKRRNICQIILPQIRWPLPILQVFAPTTRGTHPYTRQPPDHEPSIHFAQTTPGRENKNTCIILNRSITQQNLYLVPNCSCAETRRLLATSGCENNKLIAQCRPLSTNTPIKPP